MKQLVLFFCVISLSSMALTGCDKSSSSDDDALATYSTTSTRGDYSEWSFSDNDLTASWDVINDSGGTDYTFDFEATCSAADNKGVQTCTFSDVECVEGAEVCPTLPSGEFSVMAVPGVALFVQTTTGGDQLHVGFVKDTLACDADVSGDYTYMKLGLGSRDIFGLYRSDAAFSSVLHLDFGFETSDMNASQTLSYNTGTETETFTGSTCTDGVRLRSLPGGNSIRSMVTGSGLIVLDLPAGQGGLLAFNSDNAAELADFANKTFGGVSFPDNGDAEFLKVESGSVVSGEVSMDATFTSSGTITVTMQSLSAAASLTAPPYPDFSVAPTGYDASTLASSYTAATDLPGMFKFDDLDDSGRVVFAAASLNSKLVAFGAVYNYRDTGDIDPSAGDGITTFSEAGLYNTGSFIIFEQ